MISLISIITPETPIGRIMITANERYIVGIELFLSDQYVDNELTPPSHVQKLIDQLSHYFEHPHNEWDVSLSLHGTDFQQKIWQYLQTIPLGDSRSYSSIAAELNTSARAVGNACRANPFAIVIPCHRVVAKSGLGGYYGKIAGKELNVKQWLLDHER